MGASGIGVCEGKIMCSLSCALKCKLQPVDYLTLMGREGVAKEQTCKNGSLA